MRLSDRSSQVIGAITGIGSKKPVYASIKKSIEWATPKLFYEQLDSEFHFDFDPCPLGQAKENGIFIDWGKRNFVNPPYNEAITSWLEKGLIRNQGFKDRVSSPEG